jgi:hypothetical protein
MAKVWFRCNREYQKMFILNQCKELNYVPLIGDEIQTTEEDFMKTSFKIKPYCKDKENKTIRNFTHLNFKVISRKYTLSLDEWELKCEPTNDSLLYLLSKIKVV